MFKCFSIGERDGDFIKAQIPASSRETLVEPMPVLFAHLQPPKVVVGGRAGGIEGTTAWLVEVGLSWREGGPACREGRILSGKSEREDTLEDELREAETEGCERG